MGTIYLAPTQNYIQKTLNGAISDVQTTITLSSTTNLQAPGVVVINRVDSNGNKLSASLREVVYYTGIAGNDLTGCTRGGDGSTAQVHGDAQVVETMPTVGMWNNLATIVSSGLDSNGYLRSINSPVSVALMQITKEVVASVSSIAALFVGVRLDVSAASVTGLGLNPVWNIKGLLSGATTSMDNPLPMPRPGNFGYFNFVTRTVASGVSAIIDVKKNGVSIFDTVGRPMIAAGGTFVSTASIKTTNFNQGDILTLDYAGTGGAIRDFLVLGKAN